MRHTQYAIRNTQYGFTLVEMLIVVGITAILAVMAIGVAARVDNKAKQQLTESTIAILTAALQQFADFGYNYKDADYSEFDFPLDCNGFDEDVLRGTLADALDTSFPDPIIGHEPEYSGCEALYFILHRIPSCRETLDKIDKSLITCKGINRQDMYITVDGEKYPLLRVIDPWKRTLRYDYCEDLGYPEDRRTFPVITSAGPDGEFDTDDDITNR